MKKFKATPYDTIKIDLETVHQQYLAAEKALNSSYSYTHIHRKLLGELCNYTFFLISLFSFQLGNHLTIIWYKNEWMQCACLSNMGGKTNSYFASFCTDEIFFLHSKQYNTQLLLLSVFIDVFGSISLLTGSVYTRFISTPHCHSILARNLVF